MIIEIRGCTGAGKSTIMRQIMELASAIPVSDLEPLAHGTIDRPEAYLGKWRGKNIAILGDYTMPTGGMENRYGQDVMVDMIRRYAKSPIVEVVLLEGGYLSKSTGLVYGQLRLNFPYRYKVIWLETTVDACVKRLTKRRNGKPPNWASVNRDMSTCRRALDRIPSEIVYRAKVEGEHLPPMELISKLISGEIV